MQYLTPVITALQARVVILLGHWVSISEAVTDASDLDGMSL